MPNIDLARYAGREQAYVKHYLLEKYLAPLVYKVGTAWDSIVYVDGFSGPWQVNDPELADSSFGVAVETLRCAHTGLRDTKGRNVPIQMVLVEANKQAFARLEAFAANKTSPGFGVDALCGEFVNRIPAINQLVQHNCPNPFRFIFLDPKGWADIPMKELQPFLCDRSCEVLINLMTRHIIRFLDEDDRADSYKNLFGRPGVLEKLRNTPKENNEQAEQAVREYCRSLRQLCSFKYVSSAVILEPSEECVRYFLVYATNAFHGIEVFKQAEMATARTQDYIRHETRLSKECQTEFMFEEQPPKSRLIIKLRERYRTRARNKVLQVLKENTDPKGARYENGDIPTKVRKTPRDCRR